MSPCQATLLPGCHAADCLLWPDLLVMLAIMLVGEPQKVPGETQTGVPLR